MFDGVPTIQLCRRRSGDLVRLAFASWTHRSRHFVNPTPRAGEEAIQDTVTVMMTTPHGGRKLEVEIPRRIGNVKLGEPLGKGATAVVYSGFDDVLGRRVAVKFVNQLEGVEGTAGLSRFVEGVRSAAAVKHPNIVTVHHVDVIQGMPFIVMEFVDGLSLRELLNRVGSLQEPLAVFCGREIASAVAALHEAQIVHRDLKPANILFGHRGDVLVCDFGLACQQGGSGCVREGQGVAGTPLYMGPELFDGVISPQGDVYALSVILFEMVAGCAPYAADTMEEMKERHAASAVPVELMRRRGASEELIELVERAMHKARIMRHKSAGHLLRALEGLSASATPSEMMRRRLEGLVAGVRSEAFGKGTPASSGSHLEPVQSTFDLLRKRAEAKRGRN